jgi:hypothetical protein
VSGASAAFLADPRTWIPGTSPGITIPTDNCFAVRRAPYALAISGKTASILVFSVAALNGLTM